MMKHRDTKMVIECDEDTPDARRASDAVKYIQYAFNLIDKIDDSATTGMAELKVISLLRQRAIANILLASPLASHLRISISNNIQVVV